METVGLKELKTNLSRYVARAQAGDYIVVTDRGRPVAEMGPLTPERAALLKLLSSGMIARLPSQPLVLPEPIDLGDVSLSDAVLEERRETREWE